MSHKGEKPAESDAGCGEDLDARYLRFLDCFNRQRFFEAHEVLEGLWLPQRTGPEGAFYKGLIQLAGAFVHLEKGRVQPAAALFKLARANLEQYPRPHGGLALDEALATIDAWQGKLKNGPPHPLVGSAQPRLRLLSGKIS